MACSGQLVSTRLEGLFSEKYISLRGLRNCLAFVESTSGQNQSRQKNGSLYRGLSGML